ncbi:vWA domain-containing protein [Dolichospermum sp. UHCC 0684]|uniref:vWA domain-containing protein n=1 Tax=unclassified Dolichospermum TaxID=2622029 RepID=UPI0014473514|nr:MULTISPECIES: vWA domain-containing protein [unclassified Dolichospermum]MEA5528022.1 vWA domain-containing protein [Dolichospermum sp. UHCC 0684]MTJ33448.1 VWA domain-containing protein [Dolichospermum sp. UHCC 0260]
MLNPFNRLKNNKPLLFGLYGASGCLTAAILLGEPFLALTKAKPNPTSPVTPQAIVLLIDTSSSMSDGKLTEVKTAASKFIERRDLQKDQLAVVSFGLEIKTATPLTNDANTLKNAIDTLSENGGTPMAEGINAAIGELQTTALNRNIILFTDGVPDDPNLAYNSALATRNTGVKLISVATGDADINYLTQITGERSLVFYANSGQFDQAFRNAEAAIYKQLVESNSSENYSVTYSVLRIGGWTAFLAMGISLALIMGQNRYMRLPLLTANKGIISTFGSLAAGMIAGATGQILFLPLSSIAVLEIIGRIAGWIILGALVGGGTKFFVPNLKLKNALLGGTIGGGIGASGFLITANIFGDILGRLSGASMLGFFIGLMIAWIEQKQLQSQPYLLVNWTPTEQTTYLLGTKPILIGSSLNVEIPLNASDGFTPITAKIFKEEENIIMQFDQEYAAIKNMKKTSQDLKVGDTRKLGQITIEVKDKTLTANG